VDVLGWLVWLEKSFEKTYIFKMSSELIHHLCGQPMMQIIRRLLMGPAEPHLRDLAKTSSLSIAGVSDILRRLKELGILTERRIGNRRCLRLHISAEEAESLNALFRVYAHTALQKRSARFNQNALEKLRWMDQTYEFYSKIKKAKHDPT
jgi:DNA-binding MarR family transcriptional regulator